MFRSGEYVTYFQLLSKQHDKIPLRKSSQWNLSLFETAMLSPIYVDIGQ